MYVGGLYVDSLDICEDCGSDDLFFTDTGYECRDCGYIAND